MRHLRIFRGLSVYIMISVFVACGGSSPVAPTPQAPQVAGSYSGSVNFFYPQIGRSLTCPATTSVTQTGFNVSIAPMALGGSCGVSIPMGNAAIDSNGALTAERGTLNEPSCGVYSYSASGGFFGRQFQFAMVATSSTCPNFNLSGTLTR